LSLAQARPTLLPVPPPPEELATTELLDDACEAEEEELEVLVAVLPPVPVLALSLPQPVAIAAAAVNEPTKRRMCRALIESASLRDA
jgi:hypothetical protein